MSADGAALQRLPPTVARLRTCTEPMHAAASPIAGKLPRTAGAFSTAPSVVAAPIVSAPSSSRRTMARSGTSLRLTSVCGCRVPSLIWTRTSVPPARTFT